MADSSLLVSSFAPRTIAWLGKLATVAATALLAWIGAGIFWELTTPATPEPALAVDTDPQRVAQAIAARHLFGAGPARGAASGGSVAFKLQGVVAPGGRGQTGIALFSIQGRPGVAVRVGDEVAPGAILSRVLARSVEIDQAGQIQALTLPERTRD